MPEPTVMPVSDEITITTSKGESFKIHLLDTIVEIQAIEKEFAGGDGMVVVRAVQAFVAKAFNTPLTLGEADNLRDQLQLEYARKKKTAGRKLEAACRLSKFYGFGVFGLTDERQMALEYWQPRIEADQILAQAKAGNIKLSAEEWYDLTLYASGDKEAAEAAHNAAVFAQIASNEPAGAVKT